MEKMTKAEIKKESLERNLNVLLAIMQNRLDEAEKSRKDGKRLGEVALELLKIKLLGKTIEIEYTTTKGVCVYKATGELRNVAYNTQEIHLYIPKPEPGNAVTVKISNIKSIKIKK